MEAAWVPVQQTALKVTGGWKETGACEQQNGLQFAVSFWILSLSQLSRQLEKGCQNESFTGPDSSFQLNRLSKQTMWPTLA